MAKEYIAPEKRYEDQKSTGIVFLALGIVGIILTVLCWIDVLKLPLNDFQLLIMLAAFIASAFIGIWSFKRASEIAKTITSENVFALTLENREQQQRLSQVEEQRILNQYVNEAHEKERQKIHKKFTIQLRKSLYSLYTPYSCSLTLNDCPI